jgi:hypothetical protein
MIVDYPESKRERHGLHYPDVGRLMGRFYEPMARGEITYVSARRRGPVSIPKCSSTKSP